MPLLPIFLKPTSAFCPYTLEAALTKVTNKPDIATCNGDLVLSICPRWFLFATF